MKRFPEDSPSWEIPQIPKIRGWLGLRGLGRPRVESNPKAQPGMAVRPRHRFVQPGTAACCAVPSCAAWDGRVFSPIQMHDLGRPCVAESILCSQGRPHDVRLSYSAWDGRVFGECESEFDGLGLPYNGSSELRSPGWPHTRHPKQDIVNY